MRVTHTIAALSAALFTLLPAAPAVASGPSGQRGPADCARTLACTAADIDRLSMPERLEFLDAVTQGPAAEVIPGYSPRWRNIEGIITFFRDNGMGAPGSWVSYVDAGILEGIERGVAIAADTEADTFGNPGSTLWASYLTRLAAGELADRSAHDRAWSEAEQASTEHGVHLAEVVHGVPASPVETRFFEFSEFYRFVLRNRPALLDPVSQGPGAARQITFLDWFTDVGNPTPSKRGAELAYSLAEYDLPAGTVRGLALLTAYGKYLLGDYLAEVPPAASAGHGS